jgi:protoporphyrinogen oxidase
VFLFETILFYQRVPSFYQVHQEGDRFYCAAQPHDYYSKVNFPSFYLTERGDSWVADGTSDSELIDQVVRDLKRHLSVA